MVNKKQQTCFSFLELDLLAFASFVILALPVSEVAPFALEALDFEFAFTDLCEGVGECDLGGEELAFLCECPSAVSLGYQEWCWIREGKEGVGRQEKGEGGDGEEGGG